MKLTLPGACIPSRGWVQQRYVLAAMMLLGVVNLFTMRVCLSVAIVRMASSMPGGPGADANAGADVDADPDRCPAPASDPAIAPDPAKGEADLTRPEFLWSEEVQGLVLSSFYWGYVASHVPGGILADRLGGKHLLGVGVLSTALSTLLSPAAARLGPGWLCALRVLMGLGEGVTFPAVSVLLAAWVPPSERSRVGSFVFAGAQLGTVVGTALSGLLLHHAAWDATFYCFGAAGAAWCVLWQLLCYSSPAQHPFISREELAFLSERLRPSPQLRPTPWRAILSSLPVWGLVVAQVGHDWGFFTMVTDLPKYMSTVMRFSIAKNGLLSALPYLVMWVCSILFGALADWIIAGDKMSVRNVRRLLTAMAALVPAAGIMGASYAGCDRTWVVALFTAGMAGMGAYYAGMRVNALDLSRHYAGTVMALVNGMGALSGIAAPLIVGALAPHATLREWRVVFWVTFVVLIATTAVYVATAEGRRQAWDRQEGEGEGEGKRDSASLPRE